MNYIELRNAYLDNIGCGRTRDSIHNYLKDKSFDDMIQMSLVELQCMYSAWLGINSASHIDKMSKVDIALLLRNCVVAESRKKGQ